MSYVPDGKFWNFLESQTQTGSWHWNPGTGEVHFSQNFLSVFNPDVTGKTGLNSLLEVLTEDFRSNLDQGLRNLAQQPGGHEFSLLARAVVHGKVKEVQISAIVNDLDPGGPKGVSGFFRSAEAAEDKAQMEALTKRLNGLISGLDVGLWEWDLQTGKEWWSDRFYELIRHDREGLPAGYQEFLSQLLHPSDHHAFKSGIARQLVEGTTFRKPVRLKTGTGEYRWFEATGSVERNADSVPVRFYGSIADIHDREELTLLKRKYEFLLQQAGEMGKVGGWEIPLDAGGPIWSDQVRAIHETPSGYQPNITEAVEFYLPEYRDEISQAVLGVVQQGKPFDHEMQIRTWKGNVIWVRAMGKPVRNEKGEITSVLGVFMDINDHKLRELNLENSLATISNQNARLSEFARIVSHNLRNHSANLHQLVRFLEEDQDPEDHAEVLANLKRTSEAFSTTLMHLNDVVSYQNDFAKERVKLDFDHVLARVRVLLDPSMLACGARLEADFSACKSVLYLPSYLENIFFNLLSNAIRFRSPDRGLFIKVCTEKIGDSCWLEVADNGLGMDLEMIGDNLFKMFQTFHRHPDGRGLGLYLVRNQVESMGGEIRVESTPGIGSAFRIRLG